MTLKVGLIVGREWSFPPQFIEEVNRRDQGVVAEFVKLGAPMMDEPCEYSVIIDRISHEVPFYRTYLKQAALQGCTVVNNPFMWTADDKFFGAALASSLGIAHPKTVVLPNKEYIPGIVHEESLRNLKYPLDWQAIVDYVGMPCILKDAHGGGWKEVYVCRSLEELIHYYDQSGLLTMIVQEFIEWDQFIRCIVIGQEKVMPIKYDPRERKYHVEHGHLTPELGQRVVDDSLKLVRALGYDMNSMEWAVRDGVPYAIDFMNPAPDMDVYSLTPHYFDWVVNAMADMAIDLAKNPRPQARSLRWDGFFGGSRVQGGPGLLSGGRGEGEGGEKSAGDGGTAGTRSGGAGNTPPPGGTGNTGNTGNQGGGEPGRGYFGSGNDPSEEGGTGNADAGNATTSADAGGSLGSGTDTATTESGGGETSSLNTGATGTTGNVGNTGNQEGGDPQRGGGALGSGNPVAGNTGTTGTTGNVGNTGNTGDTGNTGNEEPQRGGGAMGSGNPAGGNAGPLRPAPAVAHDALDFADAAHAVPPEPAQGEAADVAGERPARAGEDTSASAASRSTEETA